MFPLLCQASCRCASGPAAFSRQSRMQSIRRKPENGAVSQTKKRTKNMTGSCRGGYHPPGQTLPSCCGKDSTCFIRADDIRPYRVRGSIHAAFVRFLQIVRQRLPRLSWARSLQTFPNLSGTPGTNIAMPTVYFREEWVQGGHRPGAEFEAAQASTFTFLVFNLIFILENKLVKYS